MDTTRKLSHTSVMLHWLVGLLMIGSLIFGIILEEMPRSADKFQLVGLHISIGLLVLIFAIWRVAHRVRNGMLEPLSEVPAIQRKIVHFVMMLLLVGTLLMPISGILMQVGEGHSVGFFGVELIAASHNEIDWMEKLGHIGHGLGSKLVIAAVLLHVLAAIKHAVVAKDGTLSRIVGKRV